MEFDYEAQQDDELSLTVGDIIVNIRRDDGGWWEGELGGRRGLFPDNFVREIKKEGKRDGGQASMIRSDLSNGRASPVSDSSVRPGRKGRGGLVGGLSKWEDWNVSLQFHQIDPE